MRFGQSSQRVNLNSINWTASSQEVVNAQIKAIPDFFPELYRMASMIPPKLFQNENKRLSATNWIAALEDHLKSPNPVIPSEMNAAFVYQAIQYVPSCNDRTNMLPARSQAKYLTYSKASPLLMAAYKIYHNIDYKYWDYEDPALPFVIGAWFAPVIEMMGSQNYFDEIPTEELQQLDKATTGYKAWVVRQLPQSNPYYDAFSTADKTFILSLFNRWIFSKQDTLNTLVINPFNWDCKRGYYNARMDESGLRVSSLAPSPFGLRGAIDLPAYQEEEPYKPFGRR